MFRCTILPSKTNGKASFGIFYINQIFIQQGSNCRASTNYIAPVLPVSDDPVEPAVNFLSSALRLPLEPNNIPARTANAPAAIPYMNISSVIFSLSNMLS
jgi:hypothetical protein